MYVMYSIMYELILILSRFLRTGMIRRLRVCSSAITRRKFSGAVPNTLFQRKSPVKLKYISIDDENKPAAVKKQYIIGRKTALSNSALIEILPAALHPLWSNVLDQIKEGESKSILLPRADDGTKLQEIVVAMLSAASTLSRHNAPSGAHAYSAALKGAKNGDHALLLLDEQSHAFAVGCAVSSSLSYLSHIACTTRVTNGLLIEGSQAIPSLLWKEPW